MAINMKDLLFQNEARFGSVGRFALISKSDLKIDPRYQRKPKGAQCINKMARQFSWMAFGCLSVTERRLGYFVFDGQHRLLAAMQISEIDKVPCLVFKADSLEEEADGFVKINIARTPVRSIDSFKAAVVARDPVAIEIKEMLDDLGVKMVDKPIRHAETKSLGSIWLHFKHEPVSLRNAIVAALAATERDDVPLLERMFSGFCYLDTRLENGVTDPRFLKRISNLGGQALLDGINRAAAYYVAGGPRVFATGILDVVNHGLRNRFVLDSEQQI